MGGTLRVIILFIGLSAVVAVFYLLVRRKINERNSLFWLCGALAILVFSTMPDTLDIMAVLAGVKYPPTLLFLLSILVIMFILLYQSIQISALQEKVKELTQRLAIEQMDRVRTEGEGEEYDRI